MQCTTLPYIQSMDIIGNNWVIENVYLLILKDFPVLNTIYTQIGF